MFRNTFSIGLHPPAFQSRDYFNFLRTINNTSSTDDYQSNKNISSTDLISYNNNNVELDSYINEEDRLYEDVSHNALKSYPPHITDNKDVNLYESLKKTEVTTAPAAYTNNFVDEMPKLLLTGTQDSNLPKEPKLLEQDIQCDNLRNNESLKSKMIQLQIQQQQNEYEEYKQRLLIVELMQTEYMIFDEVREQVEHYFQQVQQQLQPELQTESQQLPPPPPLPLLLPPPPPPPPAPPPAPPPSSSLAVAPPLPSKQQESKQIISHAGKRKEIAESSSSTSVSKRKKTEVEAFPCPICLHEFKRKSNMTEHIRTHDKNRIKRYSCVKCGKGFDRTNDLRRHAKSCKK